MLSASIKKKAPYTIRINQYTFPINKKPHSPPVAHPSSLAPNTYITLPSRQAPTTTPKVARHTINTRTYDSDSDRQVHQTNKRIELN